MGTLNVIATLAKDFYVGSGFGSFGDKAAAGKLSSI
jgi:hypothetical protein